MRCCCRVVVAVLVDAGVAVVVLGLVPRARRGRGVVPSLSRVVVVTIAVVVVMDVDAVVVMDVNIVVVLAVVVNVLVVTGVVFVAVLVLRGRCRCCRRGRYGAACQCGCRERRREHRRGKVAKIALRIGYLYFMALDGCTNGENIRDVFSRRGDARM